MIMQKVLNNEFNVKLINEVRYFNLFIKSYEVIKLGLIYDLMINIKL